MSALFTPMRIGRTGFSNRVFVSPMCQYSAVDGVVGEWHRQHYGALAVSGAGALTLEATAVSPEGRITHGCLGLWNDRQAEALAQLVMGLHALSGARVGIQIGHAGRKAACAAPWEGGDGLTVDAWPILAPSALPFGPTRATPRAMDRDDMARVREDFAAAARRAVGAGVDYLELHLAHGYLLSSFLTPLANQREDEYGGTLERRMRFVLEVVESVRAVWPADKPLGARINAHDWVDGGLRFDDTVRVCEALKTAGLDFICISAGAVAADVRIPARPGYLLDYARQVRERTALVTRAVGLLDDPRLAERAIADGDADCVAIARGVLFDPRWPMKAAHRLGAGNLFPKQMVLTEPARWAAGETLINRMWP